MTVCVYCTKRRAVNQDHVVPKSLLTVRREYIPTRKGYVKLKGAFVNGREVPAHLLELAPACHPCNIAKGARRLVPESWSHLIDELNDLFGGTKWRVWRGDAETLRETAAR